MGAGFGRVKKERNIIEKCLVSGVLVVLMLSKTMAPMTRAMPK